jgi:hypothetical protein
MKLDRVLYLSRYDSDLRRPSKKHIYQGNKYLSKSKMTLQKVKLLRKNLCY